jgi:ribose transport system substrate-binding protein
MALSFKSTSRSVMKRLFPSMLMVLLASAEGCHSSSHRVISAIPGDYTQAYFVAEHAGLSQAARRHNLAIYWNGPSGSHDNEQQIILVERAVRRGHLGIVLTPTAPFALDTVIERALARKIPVVILSAPISLPADPNLSFVLNDFQRSGLLAAERIHRLIGDEGEVAVVGIDAMSTGSAVCAEAFASGLHQMAPHIRIVSQLTGTYTPGQAETAVEEILGQHPKIAAVYSLNLAVTRGAVAAIRDSHRERKVALIGNDQALDLMFLVREHVIDSLVIQDMRGMGERAVENIVALNNGRKVQSVSVHEPVLLTSDNIDTEVMQQRLKMDWRSVP